MPRYVLHFTRPRPMSAADLILIGEHTRILDQGQVDVLVEGGETFIQALVQRLPYWTLHPEIIYPRPAVPPR